MAALTGENKNKSAAWESSTCLVLEASIADWGPDPIAMHAPATPTSAHNHVEMHALRTL